MAFELTILILLATCLLAAIGYTPVNFVRLNDTGMKTWDHDALALCMMHNSTPGHNPPYFDLINECKKQLGTDFKPRYQDAFFTLYSSAFANKVRGTCCTEDVPVSERGFDQVAEGFEDGRKVKDMIQILWELSAKNMSLVLMGDSMNNQFFWAMIEEMHRTGAGVEGVWDYNGFNSQYWSNPAVYTTLGMWKKSISYILDCIKWTPKPSTIDPNSSPHNPVYIYNMHIYHYHGDIEETNLVRVIMPFVSTQVHPDGVVVLANIGHHLGERSNPDKRVMLEKMSMFVQWLHDLTILNPKNMVFFRETTPAHFNSPFLDGSFEAFTYSANKGYDYTKPNSWDNTMYYCREIFNLSNPFASQTKENLAAFEVVLGWGVQSKVRILPVFKYLAPFHKMKYGHCGGHSRIEVLDCVHFCSNHPGMWAPVWRELLVAMRDNAYLQTIQHPYATSTSTSASASASASTSTSASASASASTSTSTSTSASASTSTSNTTAGETEVSWKRIEAANEWVIAEVVVATDRHYSLFLKRGGLLHPVDSWESVAVAFGGRKVDPKTDAIFLSDEQLSLIPVSFPVKVAPTYKDGTLVRAGGSRAIYYVQGNKKHMIPDWDTFVAMKLDAGDVHGLPDNEFDAIPVGDPMPKLG